MKFSEIDKEKLSPMMRRYSSKASPHAARVSARSWKRPARSNQSKGAMFEKTSRKMPSGAQPSRIVAALARSAGMNALGAQR